MKGIAMRSLTFYPPLPPLFSLPRKHSRGSTATCHMETAGRFRGSLQKFSQPPVIDHYWSAELERPSAQKQKPYSLIFPLVILKFFHPLNYLLGLLLRSQDLFFTFSVSLSHLFIQDWFPH